MAANPFPGMNPWLETQWGDTHTSLVTYARNQLQPQLPPDLAAVAQDNAAIGVAPERQRREPDVAVWSTPDWSGEGGDGGTATLARPARPAVEPLVIAYSRTASKRWVEIREGEGGGRLVTVIEVLSPTNKRPGAGRRDYLRKREQLLDGGVSVIEVDLVRGGRSVCAVADADLPRGYRTPYRACAYRAWEAGQVEFYRAPLRHRLPAISVPLRESDADVVLDLQPLVDAAYADGRWPPSRYADTPPGRPLSAADAAWADERLSEANLRLPPDGATPS